MNAPISPQRLVKVCSRCPEKGPQPIGNFYAHRTNADGHSGICKECYRDKEKRRKRGLIVARRSQRTGRAPLWTCNICCDLPWRRPEDGTPCKCGNVFAPEEIPIPRLIGSSLNYDDMAEASRRIW